MHTNHFHLPKDAADDNSLQIIVAAPCENDSLESMDFVSRAFQAAREMAEMALQESSKGSKAIYKTESKKLSLANTKKIKKEIQKDDASGWWTCLKVTSCPLQKFYDEDLKKKKTMSRKNFASRVYHRVDKVGSRVLARAAHRAALEFCS